MHNNDNNKDLCVLLNNNNIHWKLLFYKPNIKLNNNILMNKNIISEKIKDTKKINLNYSLRSSKIEINSKKSASIDINFKLKHFKNLSVEKRASELHKIEKLVIMEIYIDI